MVPATPDRVPRHTPPHVNEALLRQAHSNVEAAVSGGRESIARRLRELDEEWDIERTLEANAATVALGGLVLGTTVDRRFLILPGVVAGFLLQHAVQGWCPPLPVFRRLGVRTQREIDEERTALKAWRGDFEGLAGGSPASALDASRRP
jgi:hypothetical protein